MLEQDRIIKINIEEEMHDLWVKFGVSSTRMETFQFIMLW